MGVNSHRYVLFLMNIGPFFNAHVLITYKKIGIIKRKDRHLLNIARSLQFQANIALLLGGRKCPNKYVFLLLVYLPFLSYKSPYDLLHKAPLNYFDSFYSLCYATDITPVTNLIMVHVIALL